MRQTVQDIVLQGDTFGSVLASVHVDTVGQECMQSAHFYQYKDRLPVGFQAKYLVCVRHVLQSEGD